MRKVSQEIKSLLRRAIVAAESYYVGGDQGHPWVNTFTVWATDVLDGSDTSAEYADSTRNAVEGDPSIDDCARRGLLDTTLAVSHFANGDRDLALMRVCTAQGYLEAMSSTELRAEVQSATARS